MFGLEHRVEAVARKAGLITLGAALTIVGAAFLTTGLWLYLSTEHSPLFAALVIGCMYTGIGLITVALSASRPRNTYARLQASDTLGGLTPMQLVAVSFLQGLEQGRKTKQAR